MIICLYRSTIG